MQQQWPTQNKSPEILNFSNYDLYFGRIKSELIILLRADFYGLDNFSDDLLVMIEHSLPRFTTLVPVHALDVLFLKARFQKLVLVVLL